MPPRISEPDYDFPYDRIPEYQKWSSVSATADRRSINPQGPVKFKLRSDAKIASAGSCFAQRIAERISRFGLSYFIAEEQAAPYAARYGNVYSSVQLQQLLERALGTFDPLERAWETPDGRLLDPFRPRIEPNGFATLADLEDDRREHLVAVRRLFSELDVFIFTLGLTEVWTDARDGAVFPTCPGRGRGVFDPRRHIFRNLDVSATAEGLEVFLDLLRRLNPGAKVILTVSPVAIAATMEQMHVVRASMFTKSVLKVAAEMVARRHENVDYFASFDLVMQNLGDEKLFADDGRHVLDEAADRVTSLLASSYFDVAARPSRPVTSPGFVPDCDEDELLALIARDRDRGPALRAHPERVARVADAIPLYFVGDSSANIFRDTLYGSPDTSDVFIGRALYTPALYARELLDHDGNLNAALAEQLVQAHVLQRPEPNVYRASNDIDKQLQRPEIHLRRDPPVTLCCGAFDCVTFLEEIGNREIDLPPELRPAKFASRRQHLGDLGLEAAKIIAFELLGTFNRGLRLLKAAGLRNLFVSAVVPPAPDEAIFSGAEWYQTTYARYGATIVLNQCIAAVCHKNDVAFIDIWPFVTGEDGLRDPRYSLDPFHLNYAASELTVQQILAEVASREDPSRSRGAVLV